MKKNIERRTCDNCDKSKEQSEMMIGGSPFQGWLRVEMTNGSTCIPRPDTGPWDFCCDKCCVEFLNLKKNKDLGLG